MIADWPADQRQSHDELIEIGLVYSTGELFMNLNYQTNRACRQWKVCAGAGAYRTSSY